MVYQIGQKPVLFGARTAACRVFGLARWSFDSLSHRCGVVVFGLECSTKFMVVVRVAKEALKLATG